MLSADPRRADRPAVARGGGAWTYGMLRQHAAALAARSATWPIPQSAGAFAGLLSSPTPRFFASFCGLASAGWAVGVLDPTWTGEELAAALAQLDPAALLVADDRAVTVGDPWTEVDRIPGWIVYVREPDAPTAPPTPPTPDTPFYVGFTSGSSGLPKAFVRSHRSWWESFDGLDGLCPIAGGTVLIPGPLSGSHFLFGALHALHAGSTVRCVGIADLPAAMRADGLAAAYVVPSMLSQLSIDANDNWEIPAKHGNGGPEYIFCAGARLEPQVRAAAEAAFPATRLVEYYGASELSFVAIQLPGDGTPAGSVGRAFPGVEISVRDEDDRVVEPGGEGVIFARSPLVFSGYRGTAPASAARTIGDGWWTVGDRGRLDADGHLFVAGRGSGLVITGGANVQPDEVEAVVATAAGVVACAVVGLPDERWGEVVCAVVVAAPGVRRGDVRRHVAGRLSPYKRPRRYFAIDALPLGRTGKVDRSRVRELAEAGALEELR